MSFKKSSIALSMAVLITGCQTTAPKVSSVSTVTNSSSTKQEVGCGYEKSDQPEYQLTQLAKKYVTNSIKSTPYGYSDPQYRNKKYFAPVINNTFKFTVDTEKKSSYKRFQKDDIFEFNKKPYVYSGYEMVKIITSTCQVYWYERGNYASQTVSNILRADGKELSLSDYKYILGEKNLKEYSIPKATVKRDKFENSIKIVGLYDNNMMFRDWGSTKTGKLNDGFVQLYADITFLGDWAHLDHAYDEDANRRKVTRIDTDVDCTNNLLGCQLTETVGISLPIAYIETKKNGFEVKVAGKQERVLKVSAYQTKQILDAIKEFR